MDEIEIADAASGTRARIAPERGGMVTGLDALGRAVLFMDRDTLLDPSKNVRGGIPLLFPSPGKLEGDAWAIDGAKGALKQHGFARNLPWTVVKETDNVLAIELASSSATLASYPWELAATVTYRVTAGALAIEAHVENRSASPMPFGFGTHGYFALADAASFTLASKATRAFDNVTKSEVAFDASALSVGEREIDLHLLDHDAASISFTVDDVRVTIDAPDHARWVIWSLPGRPFVCVEPWTCPGNALNTGASLIRLAAGRSRTLSQTFRVSR
jgi:galactose mutarotase-like enzyme